MGGKSATIGSAWFGVGLARGAIGLVFGVDGGDGRFQVLQCEIELFGIGLLGLAAEGSLLESGDQLLQPSIRSSLRTSRAWAAISIAFSAAISSGRSMASNMRQHADHGGIDGTDRNLSC